MFSPNTPKIKKSNKALKDITIHDVFIKMSSTQSSDSKEVQKYMFILLRNYVVTENDQKVVKNIIIDELLVLKNHILYNYKKEFLINMSTDLKYNHHYCLSWMLCKWFPNLRLLYTPFWYQVLIRNNKKFEESDSKFNVTYLDLVNNMINYLRGTRT